MNKYAFHYGMVRGNIQAYAKWNALIGFAISSAGNSMGM